MRISRIKIISIPVADQQVAKTFYSEKLGFEVVRENPMGPEQHWIELAPSGAETSITLVTWFNNMPPGSVHGTVLETDDIEGTQATLQARGVTISAIDTAPWGRFATFSDPDGNGWVIQQSTR